MTVNRDCMGADTVQSKTHQQTAATKPTSKALLPSKRLAAPINKPASSTKSTTQTDYQQGHSKGLVVGRRRYKDTTAVRSALGQRTQLSNTPHAPNSEIHYLYCTVTSRQSTGHGTTTQSEGHKQNGQGYSPLTAPIHPLFTNSTDKQQS